MLAEYLMQLNNTFVLLFWSMCGRRKEINSGGVKGIDRAYRKNFLQFS